MEEDLPVFDAEGGLQELELGSDPGAASLRHLTLFRYTIGVLPISCTYVRRYVYLEDKLIRPKPMNRHQ